jgi:ABC-2 type transport system permease protein
MQYRLDFLMDAAMGVFWTAAAMLPLFVLFEQHRSVGGWTWNRALVVVAYFQILKGILDGGIQPTLAGVVEHIRKGTLDFMLLKPVDAQFMVSTSRFALWQSTDTVGGLMLLGWSLYKVGHRPSILGAGMALLLLAAAVLTLYSLCIVVVSVAVFAVGIDNLSLMLSSIFEFARWPSSVFRGALAFVFTFVIPLTLMTTLPALAVLDALEMKYAIRALAGGFAFAGLARLLWLRALRAYVGAGG